MKTLTCKSFTHLDCDYSVQGSDHKKLKTQMSLHLEQQHIGKYQQKYKLTRDQIREVMQKVDNQLMSSKA